MRRLLVTGGCAVVMLVTVPRITWAQEYEGRGTLVIRPADEEPPLDEVAAAPTSHQATTARQSMPLREPIAPGARFEPGYYRGIVPGANHTPPRARFLQRTKRNFVTWPGFEMTGDGSRVFIQSTHPIAYQRADESGRIVLVLQNTRIHLRNNRNPLVTEHFNTPVARAYLRYQRNNTLLVLEMKVGSSPSIRQMSEGNYHFLMLEFAGGSYPVPEGVREWRGGITVRPYDDSAVEKSAVESTH